MTRDTDTGVSCITWHALYEVDMNMITAGLLHLLGMDKEVASAIKSSDPQQYVIDLLKSGYEPPVNIEDLDDQQKVNFLGSLICLSMDAACFAAYRTDIHKLLKEAREGYKESLFQAINIDHSVISSVTASRLIAKATLDEDGEFFDALSKATKGGYPKKPSDKYAELNFFVYLVEDAVGNESLDYEALHELFTEQIPLYPNVIESKDSFGSFKKQIDRTRHTVKDMKT